MRSTRALLAIIVGVLALLPALAAPAASAAKPALTVKVSDTSLEVGQAFTAKGSLATRVRRPVRVQARVGSRWKTLASTRTTKKGTYGVAVTAPATAGPLLLRALAPAKRVEGKRLAQVTSKAVRATVAERASSVTARVGRTSYTVGETVQVSAAVVPALARPVELQRQDASGAWRAVGAGHTTPAGTTTLTHTVALGPSRYRLAAPASSGLAAAVSAPLDIVGAPMPTPPSTRLQVVVTGLPAGHTADVTLTGPGGQVAVTGDTVLDSVAPGQWSVEAGPVSVGTDAYHAVEASSAVQVAAGATTSVVVDYGVVVPETTTVAEPSEIVSVTDLGDGTLRVELAPGSGLASPAAVEARHRRETRRLVRDGLAPARAAAESTCRPMQTGILCEGNIFVADRSAEARNGVFARVPNGGLIDSSTLLVTTRGATLTEAVKLGRTPEVDLGKQLEVTKKVQTETFSCSGTLKAELKATAEIDPTLDFSLDVAWGRLQKAEAIARIEQTAELTASLTGEGSCATEPRQILDKALPPVTVHLGPVPVVLAPQLHVSVKAEGTASGTATVGWTEEASAEFGLTYDGTSFAAKREYQPPAITEVPPQFQGEASARATLTAGIDVLVYGVAGPRIEADAALTANATGRAGSAGATLDWTVGYDVSAHAQFVTNKDLDSGPLALESDRLEIWGPHQGPLASGTVAWNPGPDYYPRIITTSLADGEVGADYDERLATADNRNGWWELAGGSLPQGLAVDRDTGRVTGVPTAPGTATFEVRFTDGQGRSAVSPQLTISVTESSTTLLPDGFIVFGDRTINVDYDERLPEAAGQAGEWSIESGSLAPGLAFTSGGGVTGRPTTSGEWSFVARLDRPDGTTLRREYKLAVLDLQLSHSCTYTPGKTSIVAGAGISSRGLHPHAVRVTLNGEVAAEGTSIPTAPVGRFWSDLPSGVAYAVELSVDGHDFHLDAYCATGP